MYSECLRELVKAACDRAHELGFKVAAHVESPEGVKVALENGVDSIEHGAKPTDDIINLFKERNAFQVSTLSLLSRSRCLTEASPTRHTNSRKTAR